MTRRLKRLRDFDIELQIKNDGFIRPPRESQRNWLLNNAIREFSLDLQALDRLAGRFVTGTQALATDDRTQAHLADAEIMEDWQIPIMQAMVDELTGAEQLLEIGFGRGVAADLLQQSGIGRHTVIECNDAIVERFNRWRQQYPDREIQLQHGLWQERLPELGAFDAIFFHTYPLNEEDFIEQIGESTTFAEHFFPHAAAHLVEGGCFTYLSNEVDSLSRPHQRLLFRHFSRVELRIVDELILPDAVKDQWWADSMVVVKAVK